MILSKRLLAIGYFFKSLGSKVFDRFLSSKHINVESTLKQRWSSTFINVVSKLVFGWKWKLSRRTFFDVVSTLTKQCWNNVNRITSIQRRWNNVITTFKFGWKWNLSRRMFIDVVSTLRKQGRNNTERITSIYLNYQISLENIATFPYIKI